MSEQLSNEALTTLCGYLFARVHDLNIGGR